MSYSPTTERILSDKMLYQEIWNSVCAHTAGHARFKTDFLLKGNPIQEIAHYSIKTRQDIISGVLAKMTKSTGDKLIRVSRDFYVWSISIEGREQDIQRLHAAGFATH